jgi:protein-disulfide isomerase
MTTNRPAGRPTSGNSVPPTSRRSARQQRLANREANRAINRAGTGGSAGGGMNSLVLWSVVAVAVAVFVVVGLVLTSQSKANISGTVNSPGVITPTTIAWNGQTLGNANAPVTIDLYGDFRCSACLAFTLEGTEKSVVDNYVATGKAKLVWHDFLTIDTPGVTSSRDAANAGWCAADQNKFWTMHDWLYANQSVDESSPSFPKSMLADIAKAAGMDMTKFQPCLDGGTHNDAIAAEQTSKPAEVTGTPTVFVNSKLVGATGTVPTYDQIKAAIDGVGASPAPSVSSAPSSSVGPSATAVPSATVVPSVVASASPS